MRLDALQYKLETIYEFQVEQRIDDYLTTDQKFVAEITRSEGSAREQVLLRQEGNDYWLSLYLDEQVFNSFSHPSVPKAMCHQQAGDFCLAVEGVSHFLYLCWNVNYEREVTKLELELQAEVDKYLMLLEFATTDSGLVHPWLFDNWKLEEGLNDEEQARYEKANRYASKYCKGLQQRYTGIGQTNEMLRELRRFYRKTQKQKLHMIDSLNTR